MADEDDGPRGTVENTGPVMGPIYTMWENSLEKLKILNYENTFCKKFNRKPYNRVHFVHPTSNASHQFDDFSALCSWLCSEITSKPDTFKPEQYDDPNTVVNKLVLALRQFDYRSTFPPQKLKTPHGEPTCTILEFLTDKVLEVKGFQWGTPVHLNDEDVEQAQGDDQEEEDVIEDEALGGAPDEDVYFEEPSRIEGSIDLANHQILQAAIDPLEWKTELERVGPKLRSNVVPSNNEWRAHVDQTVTSKGHIEKLMGESQGDLQSLNKHISEELNQMRVKEKYINNQYNSLCLEYVEVKHKLEELEKKSNLSQEVVSRLTTELAEVSEKLEDLKESFESRDSGLHDTSPLVKIKGALQQLKEEIYAFDMRIGVVNQSLLAARVGDHNRLRAKAASKAKQRHNKNKNNRDHDDASIISD